jgi:hypothetical protein
MVQATDGHHDTHYNDIQHNDNQHKGLICDTQHKNTAIMLSVVMLSVAFCLLLRGVSLCIMSLR